MSNFEQHPTNPQAWQAQRKQRLASSKIRQSVNTMNPINEETNIEVAQLFKS